MILRLLAREELPELRTLLLLTLFFGPAYFLFLGSAPLIEPDEARYAEIAREMLERGDFITPHLNYVKYFEKPPLHYWLTALSFALLGQDEFAARFPGALAGLLGILWTYHLGRRVLGPAEGLLAALTLGTCVGYQAQARLNIIDPTLTTCLSVALGSFLIASREGERSSRTYYHLFFLSAALAVLAKGLIGIVLPLGIIGLYLILTRRFSLLRQIPLWTGLPLFLAVSAPWFIVVGLKNPEFFNFFFVHEHFQRYLSTVHHRVEPFWWYLPIYLLTILPWSFFLPAALASLWRPSPALDGRIFLWLWTGVILLFFSRSKSKLIPYILPVLPPSALLLGPTFLESFAGRAFVGRLLLYAASIACALTGVVTIVLHFWPRPPLDSTAGVIMAAIFLSGGLLGLLGSRAGNRLGVFAALCLAWWVLEIVALPPVVERWAEAERKSSKELCLLAARKGPEGARLASYGWYEQALPFYAGRRVMVVGPKGELAFGSMLGDQSAWFLEPPQFESLWDSDTPLVTIIDERNLPAFSQSVKTPPRALGRQDRRVAITNR